MSTEQDTTRSSNASTGGIPAVNDTEATGELKFEFLLTASPEAQTLFGSNQHEVAFILSSALQSRISYAEFSQRLSESMRTRTKKPIRANVLSRHFFFGQDFKKAYTAAIESVGLILEDVVVHERKAPRTNAQSEQMTAFKERSIAEGGHVVLDLAWWRPESNPPSSGSQG